MKILNKINFQRISNSNEKLEVKLILMLKFKENLRSEFVCMENEFKSEKLKFTHKNLFFVKIDFCIKNHHHNKNHHFNSFLIIQFIHTNIFIYKLDIYDDYVILIIL